MMQWMETNATLIRYESNNQKFKWGRCSTHNALGALLPELLLHDAQVLLHQAGLQVVGPYRLQQLVQPLCRLGGGRNLQDHKLQRTI